jgi:hypothetical protein
LVTPWLMMGTGRARLLAVDWRMMAAASGSIEPLYGPHPAMKRNAATDKKRPRTCAPRRSRLVGDISRR